MKKRGNTKLFKRKGTDKTYRKLDLIGFVKFFLEMNHVDLEVTKDDIKNYDVNGGHSQYKIEL